MGVEGRCGVACSRRKAENEVEFLLQCHVRPPHLASQLIKQWASCSLTAERSETAQRKSARPGAQLLRHQSQRQRSKGPRQLGEGQRQRRRLWGKDSHSEEQGCSRLRQQQHKDAEEENTSPAWHLSAQHCHTQQSFWHGGNQALCPLREDRVEDYGFTSSLWAYLGRREGPRGIMSLSWGHRSRTYTSWAASPMSSGDSILWRSPSCWAILCGVALPFIRNMCPSAGPLGPWDSERS